MVVLCSALLSATTVVALFLLTETLSGASKISMPALVGLSPAQAGATARKVGLVLAMAGNVQDPVIEQGMVARQLPLAGTEARPGQTVSITLSRGPDQVTVKGVVGAAVSQARATLKSQGLRPGAVTYRAHGDLVAGTVIETAPAVGSTVSQGARIGLVVSSGGAKASAPSTAEAPAPPRGEPGARARSVSHSGVPKVTGGRLKFAVSRLRAKGLTLGRVSYASDEDHMEEYVLSQSPAAGAPYVKGDTVNLVVNRLE